METEELTREFYQQKKWRGWKLRLYGRRKGSEDKLLNRVESNFGKDCVIYYGNWNRIDQMKGCDPSPVIGIKKEI